MIKVYSVSPLAFPQRGMKPFIRVIIYCRKGNKQTFERLLGIGYTLELILGDQKFHCDVPVIVEVTGGLRSMEF